MKHQNHVGQVVSVGGLEVHLGGAQYKPTMDLSGYDVVVPFLETGHPKLKEVLGSMNGGEIRPYPIPDFSGVPEDWTEFLNETVMELRQGKKFIAFCMGGHGRTGTFLASLIAILETEVKDPIAEARSLYCEHAVETQQQREAIFALKGKSLPKKYK